MTDQNGSVFRAKGVNRETSGAREVEDTRDTRVDLPIDQQQAQEVKVSVFQGFMWYVLAAML